ncbi:hypothetical protein GF336_00915 [Candidatus Woesearchaeota archaeon]|nr:hypothetical protein [Candidatus Woesearchaeota archaeon]
MEEIISKISRLMEKDDSTILEEHGIRGVNLSRDNFKKIKESEGKKVAFVDGGNAELLKAVNFSLSLVRIYANIFQKNKKIDEKKKEFYVLVHSDTEDGKLKYKTEIFPVKGDIMGRRFDFYADDPTLKDGVNKADISRIGGVVRRFAEIEIAGEISGNADIVVLDGSLRCCVKGEKKIMDQLYENAMHENTVVAALNKTSSIYTDKGNDLLNSVNIISPEGAWLYHPVAEIDDENYRAEISIVKLNSGSEYLFNLEVFKSQKDMVPIVAGELGDNSKDVGFPGYPYGLLMADRFAKISEEEKEYFITKFQAKAGGLWKEIKNRLNVKNSHDILNSLN